MTAGDRMNWCARCHHAIVPAQVLGGWVHFSDEDWSGWGDCPCAERLTPSPCSPPRRHWTVMPSRVDRVITGRLGSIS